MRSPNVSQPQSWFTDRFTFNPVTNHIIGVYKGGYIFKWHPDTEETHQVPASADEIAASKDGKLFITSDSNGNISVWSFTYMSVIYRLLSTDLLHGLTFGPDTQVSSILQDAQPKGLVLLGYLGVFYPSNKHSQEIPRT
jgi:WD40 repeat protein